MSIIRGIEALKSVSNANIHSIPNTHRSGHLDLFILQKKKERIEEDAKKIEGRLINNLNRLREIEAQMAMLMEQQSTPQMKEKKKPAPLPSPSEIFAMASSSQEKTKWNTVKLGY